MGNIPMACKVKDGPPYLCRSLSCSRRHAAIMNFAPTDNKGCAGEAQGVKRMFGVADRFAVDQVLPDELHYWYSVSNDLHEPELNHNF